MTEVLNGDELEITEDEEGLFDDYEESPEDMPIDEPIEETVDEVATPTETPVNEETKPFLRIRYDKEDIDLTENEAKELAERGKNYERLEGKYANLHGRLESLAGLNNMDVDAFLDSLNEVQMQLEVNKEIEGIQRTNSDIPQEILMELAQRRVEEKLGSIRQQTLDMERKQEDARQQAVMRDIEILKREFPDVDVYKLPPEVMEYVKAGLNLPAAYFKYQREVDLRNLPAKQAQAKIDKLNEENKRRSIGSTTNVGVEQVDDFMDGFLKG